MFKGETEQIKTLATNLWNNFFKERVKEMNKGAVRYFRAKVVAAASGGKITVQKPFEETTLSLPYVSSAANLTVGSECVVLVLGDYSNCIILGNGTLSNL